MQDRQADRIDGFTLFPMEPLHSIVTPSVTAHSEDNERASSIGKSDLAEKSDGDTRVQVDGPLVFSK